MIGPASTLSSVTENMQLKQRARVEVKLNAVETFNIDSMPVDSLLLSEDWTPDAHSPEIHGGDERGLWFELNDCGVGKCMALALKGR